MPDAYLVAEIPTGEFGLNGSNNEARLPPGSLTIANSVNLSEGGLVKEGGSAKYNETAVSGSVSVLGGVDWHPSDSIQRQIIFSSDGRVLRATGSTTGAYSNIGTGLNTGVNNVVFVEAGAEVLANNRKLFMFNGKNSPRIVDGDAVALTTMGNPAADWADSASGAPVWGAGHLNRLWAGGNVNDPHRAYYSTVSDHAEFTTTGAGSFAVYPGEGEKIVAGASFKGHLFLWKFPRGIYYIDSRDPTLANWRVDRLSSTIGMAGPKAFTVVDEDIVFMDSSGQFQIISNITEESRTTSNLSRMQYMGQWVRENCNMSQLDRVQMVYYAHRREVHCAIAGKGSTVNNLRIVIDFNEQGLVRFYSSDKDVCESLWMKQDSDFIERLTSGDDAGFTWNLDQDTKSKDGSGFAGEYRTAYMDLSHLDPALAVVNKNFHWLELVTNPTGNFDLNVTVFIDGTETETVTFNMGTDGAALGSFVLDTDALGGDTVLNKKRRIHGYGRRISLLARNTGAGEDFNISRMFLHFTPGNNAL